MQHQRAAKRQLEDVSRASRLNGWMHDESERDGCAIIANVKKDGRASHGNVKRTFEALGLMGHRTGEIGGEGDGAGLQTDIPREQWEKRLSARGLRSSLAHEPNFTVAHLMFEHGHSAEAKDIKERAVAFFAEHDLDVLTILPAQVRSDALGPLARTNEPEFFQIAAVAHLACGTEDREVFSLQLQLERELPVHVASLSHNSVVYKVRGDTETLRRYFPEISQADFKSAITLGHGRYSTNTTSRAERAQMFSTLGHNGEINSIDRLGREACALGFQLPQRASDSQVIDRVIESFMFVYDLSLMNALEILFPPVWSEIETYQKDLQELYRYFRRAFGALAQGPAAIIARQGDEVVFSSDALGLRPLWCGETEKEFFASSEKGVVPLEQMVRDPRPLAPGEKMGFLLEREQGVRVFEYHELQRHALKSARELCKFERLNRRTHWFNDKPVVFEGLLQTHTESSTRFLEERRLIAFGWNKLDERDTEEMAACGKEPISGLGWDGPLAALSKERKNLADYFHERVAVVTNPSIDREREAEHFSLRAFLGARPHPGKADDTAQIELRWPLLLGGTNNAAIHYVVARETKSRTLEEVLALCADGSLPRDPNVSAGGGAPGCAYIEIIYPRDETLEHALVRIEEQALRHVREGGASVLVLDDARAFAGSHLGIDAHLALAAIDTRLRFERDEGCISLRRRTSLVLRAGALRNTHDIVFALGMGADAVNPYAIFDAFLRGAMEDGERKKRLLNCVTALEVGIEKVLSTMGIHELDGYGRLFASIGLAPDVAEYFGVANYCGSASGGFSLMNLDDDARERLQIASGDFTDDNVRKKASILPGEFRSQPSVWNLAGHVARGEQPYEHFAAKLREIEENRPVSLRQLLDIRAVDINKGDAFNGEGRERAALDSGERYSTEIEEIEAGDVDIRGNRHSAPFHFSAMSFGSQGETSFRAYAEAAKRLDITCINGEGGEIPNMLGRYREHRGQQIASGRFGVNARLLNSCELLEIKIGQGAKPGEGGLLPGFKVTVMIAETRHTPVGVDLISPSNNHDIYSIEDLSQVIEELKTINPRARISVKIPSVPLLGPIATGIAKARADVINISGYDGGTGAARKHSLRHTGLPVEIGLREAHCALARAGLRHHVELWADGGVKSGRDVVKLMMLGADAVGFGTMAMAAIGCTSCRECNTGTCHVGITSQLKSSEEALVAGQKHFTPRDFERATDHLVHFFSQIKEEIASVTARAGFKRTRDLVGRVDLLQQVRVRGKLDLAWLLRPEEPCLTCLNAQEPATVGRVRLPLTSLTRVISDSVTELARIGKEVVIFEDAQVSSSDRALGTHLSGRLARAGFEEKNNFDHASTGDARKLKRAVLNFKEGSVPGNGLGAFNSEGVDIFVQGGVQDSAAKGASGGRIVILKGINHEGVRVDGSVGKCFGYGAQAGLLIVEGDADSRAGIRLSGADLIIGGRVRQPLRDDLGNIAARANIKGFGFEYQTSGRGLVLGDPGPWLCSGMTGGVVYLLTDTRLGLTIEAIERRLAKGAMVSLEPVEDDDEANVRELLGHYRQALLEGRQQAEAEVIARLAEDWRHRFVKVVPSRAKRMNP